MLQPPPVAAAVGGASAGWELVLEREVAGNLDLYVVPAGGGPERRLTDDPAEDGLARWSPDGQRIVFTSKRTGHYQVWEVPAGGGAARRVRSNGATEYQADLSPDGKQLAFLSNLDGPERLLVQDLASAAVRELVRHGSDTIFGNPHWSPDGRFITYSSNWRIGHQIYVVEVATREGAPGLRPHRRRLRAALQPRRAEGRVRQPGAPAADQPPRGARPRDG